MWREQIGVWVRMRVVVVVLVGAYGCRQGEGSENSVARIAALEPSMVAELEGGLTSLKADIKRTVTFTEPSGTTRREELTYRVERYRSSDASWRNVIKLPRRADLFTNPVAVAQPTPRRAIEIEYSDPRSMLVRFDDGTSARRSGVQDFAGATISVATGRPIHNPVLDGSAPPQLGSAGNVAGLAPFVSRPSASSATLQKLRNSLGGPVRLTTERLLFTRSNGSRTVRVVFDETAGAVIEEEVVDGGKTIAHVRRVFSQVAPDLFLSTETSLVAPILGGKVRMNLHTVLSNVSTTTR